MLVGVRERFSDAIPAEGRRQAIGDGRWKPAAGRGAQTPARGEKEREGGRRCEGEMEGRGRNSEGWRPLYLANATDGAMRGAFPEGATPNPMGQRLAWKQGGAPLSPRRILFNK